MSLAGLYSDLLLVGDDGRLYTYDTGLCSRFYYHSSLISHTMPPLALQAYLTLATTVTHRSCWSVKDVFECQRFDREADLLIEVWATIFFCTSLTSLPAAEGPVLIVHLACLATQDKKIARVVACHVRATLLLDNGELATFLDRTCMRPAAWRDATVKTEVRVGGEPRGRKGTVSSATLQIVAPFRPGSRWSISLQNTPSSRKTLSGTFLQHQP